MIYNKKLENLFSKKKNLTILINNENNIKKIKKLIIRKIIKRKSKKKLRDLDKVFTLIINLNYI